MRRNKKAFTLAEVLISMTIIGFIMAMSMSTIKIVKASYTALTYFTFKNIQNMVGEVYTGSLPIEFEVSDDENNSLVPHPVTKCFSKHNNADLGVTINVLASDYESGEREQKGIPECSKRKNLGVGESKKNIFCKALTNMINVVGNVDCDELYSSAYDVDAKEPYISNIDIGKPNFTTTNGQRYYMTSWTYNENVSDLYGYRLLAVDLNGKSRPNIILPTPNNMPDIVTFLILDNGEVFPLGVAADNIELNNGKRVQYLTSQVKGYYYSHDANRKDNVPSECFKKDKNGNSFSTCNYAVVYIKNEGSEKETSFYTYREAYCNALGYLRPSAFKGYCDGVTRTTLCPPSNDGKQFDLCKAENIKPLFRYNFK